MRVKRTLEDVTERDYRMINDFSIPQQNLKYHKNIFKVNNFISFSLYGTFEAQHMLIDEHQHLN